MKTFLFTGTLLALTACGDATPEPEPEPAPVPEATPEPEPEPEPEPLVTDDGAVASVALVGSDQMVFNADRIEVVAGRKVKLTLTHSGVMPAAAMGHNFVLLAAGTDMTAFIQQSVVAKDTDYVPDAMKGQVIAHTKVIGGGESVTIEFDAPAAGEYDFLCSFPGHAALMKGKFVVVEG